MRAPINSRTSASFALLDSLQQPGTTWLDSSLNRDNWGTRSLLATRPFGEFKLADGYLRTRIGSNRYSQPASVGDALRLLDKQTESPSCWAVGHISYEAMVQLLGLSSSNHSPLPLLHFYLYDSAEMSEGSGCEFVDDGAESDPSGAIAPTLSCEAYTEKILRIKHHIHEGDIYQANFTSRFDVTSASDPSEVYARLRRINPSTYSAYLDFGDYQLLSVSPERMFLRDGAFITTSPIKGTVQRGRTPTQDRINTAALLASEKDKAEHLMIVDLERNDLGRIAEIGSVTVDALFRPELHPSVIHLVSDISARIAPDLPMSEVFSAMFPGGSITGAPKRRAVEIIDDTEVTPRSVYTGCIGYIHGHRADFNIAIRTIIHHNGVYHVHAGGGIVADSDPASEYHEMLLKASNLFRAIGVPEDDIACLLK